MTAPRLDAAPGEEHSRPESAWWGIHVARYMYAARQLKKGRVLDVACGTGYGTSILAAEGLTVVGADNEQSALPRAGRGGVYVAGDAVRLPFPAAAFDAVVSLETIEHLTDRRAFVGELSRLLVAEGVLVLSTPNAAYTRPVDGRPRNPFHVHEYTVEELRSELEEHFHVIAVVGQRLSGRFRISPFKDDQDRVPATLTAQTRLVFWRVLNKLPARARDGISQAVWHHPLYPGPGDYVFTEDLETAPVLVVTARSVSDGRPPATRAAGAPGRTQGSPADDGQRGRGRGTLA